MKNGNQMCLERFYKFAWALEQRWRAINELRRIPGIWATQSVSATTGNVEKLRLCKKYEEIKMTIANFAADYRVFIPV